MYNSAPNKVSFGMIRVFFTVLEVEVKLIEMKAFAKACENSTQFMEEKISFCN